MVKRTGDRDRRRAQKAARKRRREAKRRRPQTAPRPPRTEAVIRVGEPGRRKLSKVLMEFAEPLLGSLDDLTLKEVELGVLIAIVVWNTVSIDQDEGDDAAFRTMAEKLPIKDGMDRGEVRSMLEDLRERKLALYPDDLRLVVQHQVTATDRGFHLMVMSRDIAPTAAETTAAETTA